jgi:hypothetical protein
MLTSTKACLAKMTPVFDPKNELRILFGVLTQGQVNELKWARPTLISLRPVSYKNISEWNQVFLEEEITPINDPIVVT